jgi:hypothetical protein
MTDIDDTLPTGYVRSYTWWIPEVAGAIVDSTSSFHGSDAA